MKLEDMELGGFLLSIFKPMMNILMNWREAKMSNCMKTEVMIRKSINQKQEEISMLNFRLIAYCVNFHHKM